MKPIELRKFISDIGLSSEFFLKDLSYYYPQIQAGKSISFPQVLKFLDYLLTNNSGNPLNMEAFKVLDRNASGQISSAELLGILKKRLPAKEYELYVQLLNNSYGPLINYIELFKKGKLYK